MGGFGRPFSFAQRAAARSGCRNSRRQCWRLEPGDRESHHPRDQRVGVAKVADPPGYGIQPAQVGDGVVHQRQREMQAPEDLLRGRSGRVRVRELAKGWRCPTSLSIRFRISGVPSVRTRPMNWMNTDGPLPGCCVQRIGGQTSAWRMSYKRRRPAAGTRLRFTQQIEALAVEIDRPPLEHGQQQRVLRPEMVIDRRQIDPGFRRDLAQRDAGNSFARRTAAQRYRG